jgi:hypothetical protein
MRFAILLAITLCALSPALSSVTHATGIQVEFRAAADVLDTQPPVDDDEPDVLVMALLTVAAAGGAAALSMIGYVIRNRVGFWLHRPPPRDGSPSEEHP